MSKGRTFQTDLLKHILENATVPLVGDAAGLLASAVAGSIYIALHTADPGETGDQTTSECSYTGYVRKAVARADAQWTVTSASPATASNANVQTFAACTGGTSTATHFSVGYAVSGTGKLFYSNALASSLAISNGITPEFAADALVVTED